ncbi:MAG TPA: alpha/beta fold hydrolase [Casimicrobiaceae bacterium]|nr:alpha/beta fold hydrolase [Casimicrobiaceae bacterium]
MWTALSLTLAYGAVFAAYATWAISRVAAGASPWPFVLALPFVYLVIPLSFVVVWFIVAWMFRADRPASTRLDLKRRLWLFWREFSTIAGNSPRMIAYARLMADPAPEPSSAPILLVHGILCNAGVWSPFRRWLNRRGVGPVYALSYGPPLASIDLFAEQVASRIDDVLRATGATRVIAIAHSMGGLVMRAYLKRFGGSKVSRLVTIATPHQGSFHAWLAVGQSVAQLRPRNPWLAQLGAPAGSDLPPIVSLWSWHDSMVTPQTSSRVEFGENVEVAGVGHTALLRDEAVFERVLEEIRKASDEPARSQPYQ